LISVNRLLVVAVLVITSSLANAAHINMVRVKNTFPETMLQLQEVIKKHGYKLSRVQRVDIGLTKSGYQTDKYRVVFFGKHDELRWIIRNHPELIPYLPLKIAIYAENKDTILAIYNPNILFEPKEGKLQEIISRWEKDLEGIFKDMREFESD
jgi:uncharacterized protein (DUF302 family)